MLDYCNSIRGKIPFWYWLVYDIALLPVVWATVSFSLWFLPAAIMFGVAVFFDITEAIVKYGRGYEI